MAYVKKAGQAIQTPGYSTGGGLLGGGTQTGIAQPTDAGTPGGWTNIQDYLKANEGSTTNIDTAKTQTANKIQQGAQGIQEQKDKASPLPEATQYSAEATNQGLADDDYGTYGIFSQGLSQQNAVDQMRLLPDVNQEIYGNAPLESRINEITQLDPTNFDKTMSFVGGLAEGNPNYSTGAKAFDTMLLQGSPEFRQNFVPQVQEQYNTLYQQPLEQARQARTQDIADRQAAIEAAKGDWQQGIEGYLGSQDQVMSDILSQQQAQEAQEADLTLQEWLPIAQAYADANRDPFDTSTQALMSTAPAGAYDDYLTHAERTGNVAPSAGTAAFQYGQEGTSDYNALVNLMNQYGGNYELLTPTQAYNPGKWTYKV